MLVLADSFDAALKLAKKYESANASLLEVKISAAHNAIVVTRGYKGLSVEKEEKNVE